MLISLLSNSQIITGAERTNLYLPIIKNKKIGLIANQTSIVNSTHLLDTLLSHEINVIKIFSPEHGFRGTADAGERINDDVDLITGIPIISLYGKNKKLSDIQVEGIDVLIFDIQDVGARFYTYISTLHYVMDAASKNRIKLIVLDRPNPNGHYVDGPIREEKFKSFVGIHPIPIVHGMTIGEYAKMINGEKWIDKDCDLEVIEMKNYKRQMHYDLPIKPSPNLPNSRSINLYPSLCLFEGTNISVGRGTDYPFQHFGSPYIKSEYSFTPKSNYGSKKPKYENLICYGTDLRYQDDYLEEINLKWIINAYEKCNDKNNFFNDFFDVLAGTSNLRKQIILGKNEEEIKRTWANDLVIFNKTRKKYLIY